MPTILLVEDAPTVSRVIDDHLTEAGFSETDEAGTTAALGEIGGQHGSISCWSIWSCRASSRTGSASR
jgi:CheY-like chemotaxis protein